ncbi:Uncharacterized protein SCG7086_AE_00020 [Chlamydiales bacterium SCGC AG-110-P3]|nr:Uncharacterized protein SCG7086_AE_00020 [Chlamydiales bacterium SCGC AG-110-P3]
MTTLCLGPDIPQLLIGEEVVHCPLIQITPRQPSNQDIVKAGANWSYYTHFIFTSKAAVNVAAELFGVCPDTMNCQSVIAVGDATAQCLAKRGISCRYVAAKSTAEGIVALLTTLDFDGALIVWPRSARARPIISDYLLLRGACYHAPIIYDTDLCVPSPLPSLDRIDTIFFSSPSTIDGFLNAYTVIPSDKSIRCIGPITQSYLDRTVSV